MHSSIHLEKVKLIWNWNSELDHNFIRINQFFLGFSSPIFEVGHNGINLIPVDPLHIPSIVIKQGAESPVNVELKFTDVDLIGLTKFRFTKME